MMDKIYSILKCNCAKIWASIRLDWIYLTAAGCITETPQESLGQFLDAVAVKKGRNNSSLYLQSFHKEERRRQVFLAV